MLQDHSAICDVPVLASSATTPTGRELDILWSQMDLSLRRLLQDSYCYSAGLNPATLLSRRDSLPPVPTRLVLECFGSSLAGDFEDAEPRTLVYDNDVKDTSDLPVEGRWSSAL